MSEILADDHKQTGVRSFCEDALAHDWRLSGKVAKLSHGRPASPPLPDSRTAASSPALSVPRLFEDETQTRPASNSSLRMYAGRRAACGLEGQTRVAFRIAA